MINIGALVFVSELMQKAVTVHFSCLQYVVIAEKEKVMPASWH